MRIVLRAKRDPDAELIGVAVGGLTAVTAFLWLHVLHLPTSSGLLRRAFHVPCPFCGGTRSVSVLLQGDLLGALLLNPLVAAGSVAVSIWLVYASCAVLFNWPRVRLEKFTALEANGMRIGVIIILAANWLYVWQAGI